MNRKNLLNSVKVILKKSKNKDKCIFINKKTLTLLSFLIY